MQRSPICQRCRNRFERAIEDRSVRCPACRDELRNKTCRTCSGRYRDESQKNTRRYCDTCQPLVSHPAKVSERRDEHRRSRVKHGGGRLDQLASMTPYTNTWWGRVGEHLFFALYPDATDSVSEYGGRSPFDAQHRDLGRVNTKTTHAKVTKWGKESWAFQLAGVNQSDTAFLIGFDASSTHVERAWLVPVQALPNRIKVQTPGSAEYDPKGELSAEQVLLLDRHFQAILSGRQVGQSREMDPPRVEYDRITLGRIGEAIYQKLYPTSLYVTQDDPLHPWDFTDPDGSRVNVRVRRKGTQRPRWGFFRSSRDHTTTDAYFFLGLDSLGKTVEVALRVPASELSAQGFSFSAGESKWSKYLVDIGLPKPVSEFVLLPDLEATHLQIMSLTPQTRESFAPTKDEFLARAFDYHRTLGFPYPAPPSDKRLASSVVEVQRYKPEGKDLPVCNAGLGVCSAYMPHRFDARNADADFSALGAFQDDHRLRRAIAFCFKSGSLTRPALRSALTALNRTPTQFRPAVAKALVESYCPEGGVVFDPCAGWGGRLMGALVAGRSYIGVEPVRATAVALWNLGMRLCEHLRIDRARVKILEAPIQATPLSFLADFALTSPPYWTKEVYDGARSAIGVEGWVEDFLKPMFEKARLTLREGSAFAVNISDVREGRTVIPLERITVETAESSGFRLEGSWRMLKSSFGSQTESRFEPILVFR